jgi:hypothetical protein
MTGAESWDRRREGASRSSGRINLIERDKSMGAKVRAEIFSLYERGYSKLTNTVVKKIQANRFIKVPVMRLLLRLLNPQHKGETTNDQEYYSYRGRDCGLRQLVPCGQCTSSLSPRHKKDGSK